MEIERIINKLENIKKELISLLPLAEEEGKESLRKVKSQIIMIIRRVYPNPEVIHKQLLPKGTRMYFSGMDTRPYYISDIEQAIRAIETIIEEFNLFGLEEFEPVKKKVENKFQLGGKELLKFERTTKS